jgi:hypothetical protein
MQASQGDNTTERPMWAEKGGLDFEGRAKWDAWTAVKGTKEPKAKLAFVQVNPTCIPCVSPDWTYVIMFFSFLPKTYI